MNIPPVLVLAYRRPDTTRQVLDAAVAAGVTQIYAALNAPNPGNRPEAEACREVAALFESLPSTVRATVLRRPKHLPLIDSVCSALDWYFDQVEEGIILEDDCVPAPSFFRFAGELLEKHRSDPQVMHISGSSFLPPELSGDASYFYSFCPNIWGWASWRRAWRQRLMDLKPVPDARLEAAIAARFQVAARRLFYRSLWRGCRNGRFNTWDYQWMFSVWLAGGLCVTPARNLVRNIGFGAGAANTADATSRFASLPAVDLDFPLRHPPAIAADAAADDAAWLELHPAPWRDALVACASASLSLGAKRKLKAWTSSG